MVGCGFSYFAFVPCGPSREVSRSEMYLLFLLPVVVDVHAFVWSVSSVVLSGTCRPLDALVGNTWSITVFRPEVVYLFVIVRRPCSVALLTKENAFLLLLS